MSSNDKPQATPEKAVRSDGTPKPTDHSIAAKVGSELGGSMQLANSLKSEMLKPAALKVNELFGSLEIFSSPKDLQGVSKQDYPHVASELQTLAKKLSPADFQKVVQDEIKSEGPWSKLFVNVEAGTVEAKGETGTAFEGKSIVLFDPKRPSASMDFQVKGLTKENETDFRNKMGASQKDKNVEIQTTDGSQPLYRVRIQLSDDLSGTDPEGWRDPLTHPTSTERKMAGDVTEALSAGDPTSMDSRDLLALYGDTVSANSYLKQNTINAPLNSPDSFESARKTQPQEIKLIQDLNHLLTTNAANGHSDDKISMRELTELALKECNGDQTMALLTLANFSKNVACIERRQFSWNNQNDKDLHNDKQFQDYFSAYNNNQLDKYDHSNIDNIFNHIEGFDDRNGSSFYNKEGAFYHFWGAAYASNLIGTNLSTGLVGGEMLVNKHNPIEYGAGKAGASVTTYLDDDVMDFNN